MPFFAPVVATGLRRCWATDLSAGGIGLTAFLAAEPAPARGDELELELPLGDRTATATVRVRGRVAWTSIVRLDGRLGLGAQFRDLSSSARARLALFLAEHSPFLGAVDRTAPPTVATRVVRESPAMQRVYELLGTAAAHDVPVLLAGETGTGKELAAREIHALGARAGAPFIAQDCSALTDAALDRELFGHVRGAFAGATTDHPGLCQLADGGTLFLDEIQHTSPSLQAKLLRLVEHGEVRPVGGTRARRVDVRLIAASNADLKAAVREARFRADFFYRLNRFPIDLPPLRAHVEDILPLTQLFLERACRQMGRPLHPIDPRAERALLAYDWPGNIRELHNAIERALLLTPADEPLRWAALPAEVCGCDDDKRDRGLEAQVDEFERRLIREALERNDGVIRRAARDLAVNAVTLARRMKRLGLG